MIEYEIKKNKRFQLNIEKEYKLEGKLLNFSICHDISLLLISTDSVFYQIYTYSEFLMKNKAKYVNKTKIDMSNHNKRKNYFPTKPIFEINPYSDDRITMALAIDQTIIVLVFYKKKYLYEINHGEQCNCKFIQWENDLLICAFENKIIKIIKNSDLLETFKDGDYITSMKEIHFQECKLLITGYNRKVIIRNFNSILNLDNELTYIISKFEGKIDLIEYNNPYILFCSKKNNVIYCYRFLNNNWKPIPLFEIYKFKNLEEEQEIINANLILNLGIIVSFINKIYIFSIKNDKEELQTILNYDKDISYTTFLFNRNYYYYYLIIVLKEKIDILKIDDIDNSSDLYKKNNFDDNQELINTCINTLLNRKNEFTIKKIDHNLLQAEMEDCFFKIEFDVRDKSININLFKCGDFRLKQYIEEVLEQFNNEEDKDHLESLTEKLIKLNNIIKSFYNTGNESEENIEKNDLFEINIKKEIFLEYYKILKNWQEIIKNKTPINNLYKEEEDLDSYNKIILSSFRELSNWDFSFENLDIDKVFELVNSTSNYYSSSKESEHIYNPFYSFLTNKKDKRLRKKSISTTEIIKKEKEKLNDSFDINNIDNSNNDSNDEPKVIINKLTKETFKMYLKKINKIKNSYNYNENIFLLLLELLKQIKYYIEEIVNQKSSNLIHLYIMNLFDIFTLLEKELNLALLFICILPISTIIYNEIEKVKAKDNPKYIKNKLFTKDLGHDKRIFSENILRPINNNSGIYSNSDINDMNEENNQSFSDLVLNAEEYKNDNKLEDLNIQNNFFQKKKYSKNSADLNKTMRMIPNLRSNISFSSNTNRNEKNLMMTLGSNFCNTIIDYVTFFSEELSIIDKNTDENNAIVFFKLVNKFYESKPIINEINEIINKAI